MTVDQRASRTGTVILVVGREGAAISPDLLRAARERRGLNQRQLAEATGIHASDISDYERGRVRPDAATLARLTQALDVDALDLLEPGTRITLQVLRIRAGLTQTQAAERAKVSRSTWAAVERGDTRLGGRAEQFARALSTARVVTTAEQVAEAAGNPQRTRYVLPEEVAGELESAQLPGEDLMDTLARLVRKARDAE